MPKYHVPLFRPPTTWLVALARHIALIEKELAAIDFRVIA